MTEPVSGSLPRLKVLFVCLGNICRSPLAEGIFKKMAKQKGLENMIASDSAGTSDYHIGEAPDKRTINNAKQNGLELHHKVRQVSMTDFDEFDYIITMDSKNFKDVSDLMLDHPNPKAELVMMRNFDDDESRDSIDVPDPYFGGESGFQKVYGILYRSMLNFIENISEKHKLKA